MTDRAMIAVSIDLRNKYPHLRFGSCTRLPDAIVDIKLHDGTTLQRKLKASYETSLLTPWKDGEEGLENELRALHGGLHPVTDVVVADDPIREMAARTWIDEKALLRRDKLLLDPGRENEWLCYDAWLQQAESPVATTIRELNAQEFLVNKYTGDLQPSTRRRRGRAEQESEYGPGVDGEPPYTTTEVYGLSFRTQGNMVSSEAAFYVAAETGDLSTMHRILASGHVAIDNVFATGVFGSALAVASVKGHVEIARLLVERKADGYSCVPTRVEVEGITGGSGQMSPVELACMYGHVEILDILAKIPEGDFTIFDTLEMTVLQSGLLIAAVRGHTQVVAYLLEACALIVVFLPPMPNYAQNTRDLGLARRDGLHIWAKYLRPEIHRLLAEDVEHGVGLTQGCSDQVKALLEHSPWSVPDMPRFAKTEDEIRTGHSTAYTMISPEPLWLDRFRERRVKDMDEKQPEGHKDMELKACACPICVMEVGIFDDLISTITRRGRR
jgi:hypothetical protein